MNKSIPFIGHDAIARQKEKPGPLKKRLVQFLLQDPEAMLYHHEPILYNGKMVGYLSSGNYGHTLGGSVGLGYVKNEEGVSKDFIEAGRFEIDVAGVRIPARASLSALYDPRGERLKS
jgi:4-methylaminobutanoate oxidase (formaldehyde-forming)